MPKYVVKIETDVIIPLDQLEDVVYDAVVDKFGGDATGLRWITNEEDKVECAGGVTDVLAEYA